MMSTKHTAAARYPPGRAERSSLPRFKSLRLLGQKPSTQLRDVDGQIIRPQALHSARDTGTRLRRPTAAVFALNSERTKLSRPCHHSRERPCHHSRERPCHHSRERPCHSPIRRGTHTGVDTPLSLPPMSKQRFIMNVRPNGMRLLPWRAMHSSYSAYAAVRAGFCVVGRSQPRTIMTLVAAGHGGRNPEWTIMRTLWIARSMYDDASGDLRLDAPTRTRSMARRSLSWHGASEWHAPSHIQ
ncbi:hypothetical protein C8Q77DRAFT_92292 [Trametes polyzona]|nr:hypothetical protein C8Q77DRAFT_92292 [Trametes polyzona]